MSQAEWLELYRRLMLYTYKRYGWVRDRIGVDPQDLVQQAIIDTLEGKRLWPSIDIHTGEAKKDTNLFLFLCSVISSKASHLLEKERLRPTVEISELEQTEADVRFEMDSSELVNFFTGESPVRYFELTSDAIPESQIYYGELVDRVSQSVAGDTELMHIVESLLQSPDLKPKEIAEQLGLSLPQIYTALKRLRRRLHGLREEMRNG